MPGPITRAPDRPAAAPLPELRQRDPDAYRRAPTLRQEERLPALADDAGDVPAAAVAAQADAMVRDLGDIERLALDRSMAELPAGAIAAMRTELGLGAPAGRVVPADEAAVAAFATTAEGKMLTGWWGGMAPHRIGVIRHRFERAFNAMDEKSAAAAADWFNRLPSDLARQLLLGLAA